MKKVLLNAYTNYNFGDDLFIKVIVERFPEVKFILLAPSSYYKFADKYSDLDIMEGFSPFFVDACLSKMEEVNSA